MQKKPTLYMVLIGCTPEGRLTEQHDVFFGIANSLEELVPQMDAFWPEAKGLLHIDAWRKVTVVDGFIIEVIPKENLPKDNHLFFINLGGYKENAFEEYHYKLLAVGPAISEAIRKSKKTAFYTHCGFDGAVSHIDDKYGIDVDEVFNVEEVLGPDLTERYQLKLTKTDTTAEDPLHIGYLKIAKLLKDGEE